MSAYRLKFVSLREGFCVEQYDSFGVFRQTNPSWDLISLVMLGRLLVETHNSKLPL